MQFVPYLVAILGLAVLMIVHEGGHALAALATGRHLSGVRLYRSTAGETVSAGRGSGPGIALTAAAGYPAPSLLGLGAAADYPAAVLALGTPMVVSTMHEYFLDAPQAAMIAGSESNAAAFAARISPRAKAGRSRTFSSRRITAPIWTLRSTSSRIRSTASR